MKIGNRPNEEFGLNPLLLKFSCKDSPGAAQFLKQRNRNKEGYKKKIYHLDNWVGSLSFPDGPPGREGPLHEDECFRRTIFTG